MSDKIKTAILYLVAIGLIILLCWPKLNQSQQGQGEAEAEHVADRDAFRRLQLQNEYGQQPTAQDWITAYTQKENMIVSSQDWREFWRDPGTEIPAPPPLPWVSIGPGNAGGRVRSLVIHPTEEGVMWAGGVGGGIWKTLDGGASWSTTTDFLENLNISSLIIDPNNPSVLYAGTGGTTFTGDGIFKTTDGGDTWQPLPATRRHPDFLRVNQLAISPNSQVLLAATETGMFLSRNGGGAWTRSAGIAKAFDVHFHPSDSNRCIAGGRTGDPYFSLDAGVHWQHGAWNANTDGPVKLAYARSAPEVVYAQSVMKSGRLYRSTDGGRNYSPRGTCCNNALTYAMALWVDPTNPNIVVYGGGALYRSMDGGLTGTGTMFVSAPHEDHQVLVEDPHYGTNKVVYCGTDGGVFRTDDVLRVAPPPLPFGNSNLIWVNLNHSLGVTQFYGATASSEGVIIGGTQDNGTLRYLPEKNGSEEWQGILGNDGGYAAADRFDPSYFYLTVQNLGVFRTADRGINVQFIGAGIPHPCNGHPCANFIAPIVLDPNNPNCLLAAGNQLWRTNNPREDNVVWDSIKPLTSPIPVNISAVAIAEGDPKLIWVGHNDGSISYTINGTASTPTWTKVTAPLPQRLCNRIVIGPAVGGAPRKIYATFGGFSDANVWRFDGQWQEISGFLPFVPVYSIAISPIPGTLYVGTEMGVFASHNDGQTWSPSNGGPANVVVFDLLWMQDKLVAATFGRGVFVLGPTNH